MAQIVKIHFNGAFIWALPNRKEKLAQFLYEVILGQKANLKIKKFKNQRQFNLHNRNCFRSVVFTNNQLVVGYKASRDPSSQAHTPEGYNHIGMDFMLGHDL